MQIHIAQNRAALGSAAGQAIAAAMRQAIAARGRISVAFAAAPSQNETLATLTAQPGIAWDQIDAFHLDEYAGATPDSPHSFRRYLREHVPPATFHTIRGEADDPEAECARYASLLPADGFDIALLGIGENGHLAFNDPPCDFFDTQAVRVVTLDAACRAQQVHDGAFATLNDVPKHAFTLTIPILMEARQAFVMAPGAAKATAVCAALEGPVSPLCPASILRLHPRAALFLDRDSAALLSARKPASESGRTMPPGAR